MYDDLRLYDPSMAASNDRMVSKGRSRRGRVGFDRSGSAGKSSASLHLPKSCYSAPIILPCASRCWMLRMDPIVDLSKAVAAVRMSVAALHRQCKMQMHRACIALTWLGFVHRLCRIGFRGHPAMGFFFGRLCQIHLWNAFRTVAALAATEAQHRPSPRSPLGCHYDRNKICSNECDVASPKQDDSRYRTQKRVSDEFVRLLREVGDRKQKRYSHRRSWSCSYCVGSCRSLGHPDSELPKGICQLCF